jgi:hypothetical protein
MDIIFNIFTIRTVCHNAELLDNNLIKKIIIETIELEYDELNNIDNAFIEHFYKMKIVLNEMPYAGNFNW